MMVNEHEARRLLDLPVQVVAGKGGVGRTAIACAMALRSARDGERTLLLECNAPDSAARYLGVRPAPDEPREVLNNLWLCRMTPAGALREYALMVLRFRALYNFVFENPLLKYFLRSIPALGEFTMMGKAWYHSTETLPNGRPRYGRIIIDAPATGHALTLLSVSRVVADTVPRGIMRKAAEKMATLLESRERACLHLVATPEEMPVNEALQLAEMAESRLRMATGLAIVNRVLPPLLGPGEAAVLERLPERDDSVAPYLSVARRRTGWERWQRDCIERFGRESGKALLEVPELAEGLSDRDGLEQVVEVFDRAAGVVRLAQVSDGG